jgi:subtilisin family serine protease
MTRADRTGGTALATAGAAWLVLAVATGASGILAAAQPPTLQLVLLGLTILLAALSRSWPDLRRWAMTVDVRVLVLVHVSRLVGLYFLVLYGRGELPYAFAVPGGLGDIAVAVAAIAVAALLPPAGRAGWRGLCVWNLAGLIDILLVVATAARLNLADPASMAALTRLPLSLLPTFLVPIIIWTHAVILVRLAASRRAGYRAL